jgi:hypothetical protein
MIPVGSVVTDLLSIRFSTFGSYWTNNWDYIWTVNQLLTDLKTAYDLVKGEALYSILLEFDVPTKLVRLNKM